MQNSQPAKASLLDKSLKLLLLFLLVLAVLHYAKPFLFPFLLASVLAMLLLPLCIKLERKIPKPAAVLLSVCTLLVAVGILATVVGMQVSNLSQNAGKLEKNVTQKIKEFRTYATRSLGISQQKQQEIIQEQQQSSKGRVSALISGMFSSVGSLLTNLIIVVVYIFLFLMYRSRFQQFVRQVVPQQSRAEAETVMHDVRHVVQKYLTGLSIMIACLWVMYGIGFSIVGVKNGVFFAVLCGLLEIVPFVGNLAGVAITMLMALAQGGDTNMLIGILITYGIVQFLQTYLLEPLIVGKVISINPMFTIVGLVSAELIWGIPGLVLALPLLGIAKIVCDHVEPLKPWGRLMGDEEKSGPKKKPSGLLRFFKK